MEEGAPWNAGFSLSVIVACNAYSSNVCIRSQSMCVEPQAFVFCALPERLLSRQLSGRRRLRQRLQVPERRLRAELKRTRQPGVGARLVV
jgi:hypothetical protein